MGLFGFTTVRVFRKIHLWLSVPFGIVISLVCFSGAMLVFEKELTRMANPDMYRVESGGRQPLPMDVLVEKAGAELPRGVRITGVTVSGNPGEAYSMSLSKPRRAAVYVDQYTGEVKGRQERPVFFAAMFSLHRWLLDKGRPEGRPAYGKIVVGVSTMMFVVALLSGVVIWWPRTRKALRNSLKITAGKGSFRLWHSLHVAGGMYALVLLLVMALTGLTWSFTWYRSAFYSVFGVEMTAGGGGRDDGGRKHDKPDYASWQRAYSRLQADNPHAVSITVGDGTAQVAFSRLGNPRAADRYTFDRGTGRITSVTRYADAAPSGKMRGWIYSVHTGSFGGLPTRLLWFFAALLGALLPVTGYYLWLRRLRRNRG